MAERLSSASSDDPIFLIKFAKGSTSLRDDWNSDTGELYEEAISFINTSIATLEEDGYCPSIDAICWMQGEKDSYLDSHSEYKSLEKAFIEDIRNDLSPYASEDGIGFVDAGISQCPYWANYEEINKAKFELSIEDEDHVFIDTIAAGLSTDKEPYDSPDSMHYDSSSMIELGRLFGTAIIDHFL